MDPPIRGVGGLKRRDEPRGETVESLMRGFSVSTCMGSPSSHSSTQGSMPSTSPSCLVCGEAEAGDVVLGGSPEQMVMPRNCLSLLKQRSTPFYSLMQMVLLRASAIGRTAFGKANDLVVAFEDGHRKFRVRIRHHAPIRARWVALVRARPRRGRCVDSRRSPGRESGKVLQGNMTGCQAAGPGVE